MINYFKRLYNELKHHFKMCIMKDILKDVNPKYIDDMIRKSNPKLSEAEVIRLRRMLRGGGL